MMKLHYGLTFLLLFLLSACGSIYSKEAPTSLTGATWILTELNGQLLPQIPNFEPPSMIFDGKQVQGSDGCNRFQGSYEAKGGQLTFGPLAATRRFCAEPVAGVEQGFNQALTVQTDYRLLNGRLELLIGEDVLAKFSVAAEKAKSHSK